MYNFGIDVVTFLGRVDVEHYMYSSSSSTTGT